MESAYLGIVLWLLLAAMAGRYLIIRPTDRDDRIGALVFFIVIGLPIFILGLVLIVQPSIA
jgi:ABC-type dipeptide/oligopeptide/nickel transport system permease component